ncbi:MAG: DNA-deoxyinosine glycosylase [Proteobacteria bacterium]|nr:DNA-deoxyinosine glycosylase [Pseudomonadota bacterium]
MLRGFPPIIDKAAGTLILGSFPSEESLRARQYYAFSRNQFWPLLAAVLGVPLSVMDYSDRKAALHRAGIAVWDVYASCERAGSLDSAIRNAQANDFEKLKKLAPRLRRVCFNGQKAARFARQFEELGYATHVLPSSSPLHTLVVEKKLAAWRAVLGS